MTIFAGLIRRCIGSSAPIQLNYGCDPSRFLFNLSQGSTRLLSGEAESNRAEFPVENAYDILSVPETSSIAEIKASFRRLAKETHPDLVDSKKDSSTSIRFVHILAAYEVQGSFTLFFFYFCDLFEFAIGLSFPMVVDHDRYVYYSL